MSHFDAWTDVNLYVKFDLGAVPLNMFDVKAMQARTPTLTESSPKPTFSLLGLRMRYFCVTCAVVFRGVIRVKPFFSSLLSCRKNI